MKDHLFHTDNLDPFGLRKLDLSVRIPERSEMFTEEEARTYIQGCDYPESNDDLLLALEMERLFGRDRLNQMTILDTMCGPGRLGRELSGLGANHVIFHDGSKTMLTHAIRMALTLNGRANFIQAPVDHIPLPDNMFDLVVCHNSTHQLASLEKLRVTMQEFLRLTQPGGHIVIADYQRGTAPEFLAALEERLKWTKPEIVPLLLPTFLAAFSKQEFSQVASSLPGVATWSVTDAQAPNGLSPEMLERVAADSVKGHILDFSPISQRVIIQKKEL